MSGIEASGTDHPDPSTLAPRGVVRDPVLRIAKILFGPSVITCLVLDQSQDGVRISTETPTAIPDHVCIEFGNGIVWSASRRWQRGLETGLQLIRFEGLSGSMADVARKQRERLLNTDALLVLRDLAASNHFDNPALRAAANSVETALRQLDQQLEAACTRRGSETAR